MKLAKIYDVISKLSLTMLSLIVIILMIEILKEYYVTLLGVFGFIAATSTIAVQMFQYMYIKERAESQTTSFLKHSVMGYGVLFMYSIILYYLVEHTKIPTKYILYGSVVSMIIIWALYFFFLRDF